MMHLFLQPKAERVFYFMKKETCTLKKPYSIIPGAEPFFFKGNDIGILVSHGFNGTPQSMRYVGERLAEKGYTVLGVRLKGHGTHYKDLERCYYEDWIRSLEEGYEQLAAHCKYIYVVGQSMGATLALTLAHSYPCAGVITINAAFSVPCYEEYEATDSPRYIEESAPDIKDSSVHEIVYDTVPVASIRQLLRLIPFVKARLSSIHCPVLLLHSQEDHVVPANSAHQLYDAIGSTKKHIIPLTNSYHVASMDFDKDRIVSCCTQFIERKSSHLTPTI